MTTTLKKEITEELYHILDFWGENTVDLEYGGFYGEINNSLEINKKADKSLVLNARLLWSFSAGYIQTQKEEYLTLAKRAYNYLIQYFLDPEYGGFYWAVDFKGNLTSDRKQTYAQGFAIYGLSEYYRASADNTALKHAIDCYEVVKKYTYDNDHKGYIEALDRNWQSIDDMRLSEKDANFPKSMNTHLHILEPFTNLYRVWKNTQLKEDISELIDIFSNNILNKKNTHLDLFFEMDWQTPASVISYGHDIEGAWLLDEAAQIIGEKKEATKSIAMKMVDTCLVEGFAKNGAVLNELEEGQLHKDFDWWPQAEALVGLVMAYNYSQDQVYMDQALMTWEYIKKQIIDTEKGEWFWGREADGSVKDTYKAGFWKCPYHNSRACIEVINRLN
ncbi:AGE family epimerase/isomerase [Flammeovirga sp. SubArs3]|uniref:AGE family epimerase/isomerase n=1 Tax=Flammeovirga sp. SubArs3 TaxID=2995316 RepID=UPI00248CFD3D|nr:AGE family epimerase/isomerase [Flammeovirga sp. SubArs3]